MTIAAYLIAAYPASPDDFGFRTLRVIVAHDSSFLLDHAPRSRRPYPVQSGRRNAHCSI
jgi:hypothetical protein